MNEIKLGLDLDGGVSITYQAVKENPTAEEMSDTIYKLQQRVEGYSNEAQVYQEGDNRINVDIPGVSDANAILEELGKPGSLYFMDMEGNVILTGDQVASAQEGIYESQTGQKEYIVSLTFTDEGAEKFSEATSANIGNPIAIVYDGELVSSPIVQSAITDGRCQIDGIGDFETARQLAATIRIGSLSLELTEFALQRGGRAAGRDRHCHQLKGRRHRFRHRVRLYDGRVSDPRRGGCAGPVPVCGTDSHSSGGLPGDAHPARCGRYHPVHRYGR